jgi:hypothetical protein
LTVVLFDVSLDRRPCDQGSIRGRVRPGTLAAAIDGHGTVVGDVIDDNPLAHDVPTTRRSHRATR